MYPLNLLSQRLEIGYRFFKPFPEGSSGFPTNCRHDGVNIRFTLLRIIGWQRKIFDFHLGIGKFLDQAGEFQYGEFTGIPEVEGSCDVGCRVHDGDNALYQVIDIAETACLVACSVNCQWLVFERLDNKVAYDPAIIWTHVRTISVEDPHYLYLGCKGAGMVEKHRFRQSLSFVVARSGSDGIHVSPIVFFLGMHKGISIDFTCRSLKNSCIVVSGQFKKIQGAGYVCFDGFQRVRLVKGWRGRACHVIDPLSLYVQVVGYVAFDKGEVRVVYQRIDIAHLARGKIIQADDFLALV